MNVNQKIEHALESVTEHIWPMVCPEDTPPEMYITYNPALEEPELFADDTDQEWVQYMQVHLYKKGNFLSLKEEIRLLLRANQFVVTGIETFYERDTRYYHLCFECYIEEEM